MKAPVAIGESVKIPLNPKVTNAVKVIEKEGSLTLNWLRWVNNISLIYTLRYHTHFQQRTLLQS